MPDIPYGDCFTVEARWDIYPKPAVDGIPRVKIQAHVMVSFTKTTIWRKAIESGVIASCKTAHEECVLHIQACAPPPLSQRRPAIPGCCALPH